MLTNFTHTWRDTHEEYSKDTKGLSIAGLDVNQHVFFRNVFGWSNNLSINTVISSLSSAYDFVNNAGHISQKDFIRAADIWDVLSSKLSGGNDDATFERRCDIEDSADEDELAKSVIELNKFVTAVEYIKNYMSWVLSKEVRLSMEDCISINSKVIKALAGVICFTEWSMEGVVDFYSNGNPIKSHLAECYMSFPNFKEFLKFQYNLATICGKTNYKFRFKDICTGNIYSGAVDLGNSFEEFLGGVLKFVGAESKNVWDDGSGDFALFYGDDETGNIYNQSPRSGIIHYRLSVPVPMMHDGGVYREAPVCKLGYFSNNTSDGRIPVTHLSPVSGWLDDM